MRKTIISTVVAGLFVLSGCSVNPFTGKSNMALVSNAELFPMSFQEYDSFLKEHKVKRITMVYKKEKLPLGKVEVRSLVNDKNVYQEILNDEEEVLTLSKTEFIAR